jgi:2-aminoadipate transaminase
MMSFDFSGFLRAGLTPPAAKWNGWPEFNFVGGHNDEASVPVDAFRAAADAVLAREGATLGMYFMQSGSLGYLPLREYLTSKLAKYAGIDCTADQILLTTGSLQGIDLVNDVLLESGDTVVVEESNYGGVFPRLKRLNVNIATVPVDDGGMDIDALSNVLDTLEARGVRAKYIFTIPTVHNPTGAIMPLERRRRLLALARSHDTVVFEDECYADLVWAGSRPPALRALDTDGRVIHIGTFSKTIAPALRVGYMCADWSVLSRLLTVKYDAGSGALEQMLLSEYCPDNFDDHLTRLNKTLEAKLDALTAAIDEEFGAAAVYQRPPGGIFLWVGLPDNVDTTRLASIAGTEGVAINPGPEWSMGEDARQRIRICFANPDVEMISAGIAKLADICHREFGTPERGGNRLR